MDELHMLPAVAREAIRAHLEGRDPVPCVAPDGDLARPAAVFVTLRQEGALRGCMGEMAARHEDLVAETMDRAVVAAFSDPRFPPVTLEELPACRIEVTILGRREPVDSEADLDPRTFGIEVADGSGRSAVLLPGIEGIDGAAHQIALARRKAGIDSDVPVRMWRFRARKIGEAP